MSCRRSKVLAEHTAVDKDKKPLYAMFWFWCPGCNEAHAYAAKIKGVEPPPNRPMWTFDENMDAPTFTPSLRIISEERPCHLFVKNGHIQYCGDCFHELKGKIVPMVEIPDWI